MRARAGAFVVCLLLGLAVPGPGRRPVRRGRRLRGGWGLIFKPRDQWHTFRNAGDKPARLLEIISPANFEQEHGLNFGPPQ